MNNKYIIEKYFKGVNYGIVGDVIYYNKEKADITCNALQAAVNKFTNKLKYVVKKL